ncbi:MAG: hypothetical protein ACI9L9_000441 [Marivirga sp.]|jgi:hypothetical protein
MKMFKLIFTSVFCAFYSASYAQSYTYSSYSTEAILFSQPTLNGTARITGLGGTNVSLGGDISSIGNNPAGLGFFNRSSWSVSSAMRLGLYESAPVNGENKRNASGFNWQLPNMGLAFHQAFDDNSGWVSGTFGVGYNQQSYFFNGINYQSTIAAGDGVVQDFVEYALAPFLDQNGDFLAYGTESAAEDAIFNDYYADLAFNAGLLNIYENTTTGNYEIDRYDYDPNGYLTTEVSRREIIVTSGGLTTVDLAYGANYKDKLYVGGALNINFLNYEVNRDLREIPNNALINSYTIEDNRILSGAGAGLTIGAIYKPISMLNLGLSYTTPSFMIIEERQTLTITPSGNQFREREIINEVPSYAFIKPQKVSLGATVFLSKYGFLTTDITYVDYTTARYRSSQGAFASDEITVDQELKPAINANIGAEARLGVFRLRAGYAYFQSPFDNEFIEDQYISDGNTSNDNESYTFQQDRSVISAGVGIIKNGFAFDAAVNIQNRNNAPIDAYSSGVLINSSSNISTLRVSIGKSF